MPRPLVLLTGGRSTEHDASLHSYRHVLAEVCAERHRFALSAVVYVCRDGGARIFREAPWPVDEAGLLAGQELPTIDAIRYLTGCGAFTFSLLHGTEGEDGSWQGVAEVLGLRGSFGPVMGSALGMDKFLQSVVAASAVSALRCPPTTVVRRDDVESGLTLALTRFGDRDVVVKPNRMGASLLTEKLSGWTMPELAKAVSAIHEFDAEALVQEFVHGDEYSCGVLEEQGRPVALPVLRIETAQKFFGHAEKHHHDQAGVQVEATPVTHRIQRAAEQLFRELKLFAWSRFDFIVADDQLFFLEANTIPGLMSGSLFPAMLRADGRSVGDLIELCVDAADSRQLVGKRLVYHIEH
jgi:D-alanine-D-alanine ligase